MRFRDSARDPCLLGTDFSRPGSGPDLGNHWVTGDTTGTDHVTESAPGRRARGAGLESCHRDSRGSMARKGARHMGTSAPTRGLSGCGWPGQKRFPSRGCRYRAVQQVKRSPGTNSIRTPEQPGAWMCVVALRQGPCAGEGYFVRRHAGVPDINELATRRPGDHGHEQIGKYARLESRAGNTAGHHHAGAGHGRHGRHVRDAGWHWQGGCLRRARPSPGGHPYRADHSARYDALPSVPGACAAGADSPLRCPQWRTAHA